MTLPLADRPPAGTPNAVDFILSTESLGLEFVIGPDMTRLVSEQEFILTTLALSPAPIPTTGITAGLYLSENSVFDESDTRVSTLDASMPRSFEAPRGSAAFTAEIPASFAAPELTHVIVKIDEDTLPPGIGVTSRSTGAISFTEAETRVDPSVVPAVIRPSDFDFVEVESTSGSDPDLGLAGDGLVIINHIANTNFAFSWQAGGGAGNDVIDVQRASEAIISTGGGQDIILVRPGGSANARLLGNPLADVIVVAANESDVTVEPFSTPLNSGVNITGPDMFFRFQFAGRDSLPIVFAPDLDASAIPSGLADIGTGFAAPLTIDQPGAPDTEFGDGDDFVLLDRPEAFSGTLGVGSDIAVITGTGGGFVSLGGTPGTPPTLVDTEFTKDSIVIPGRPPSKDGVQDVIVVSAETEGDWTLASVDGADRIVLWGFDTITSRTDLQLLAFKGEDGEVEYRLTDSLTLKVRDAGGQFLLEDAFTVRNANGSTGTLAGLGDDGSGPTRPPGDQTQPIKGTQNADRLTGTSDGEVIQGRGGPDILRGKGGADVLIGGGGKDRLIGGGGDDQIRGGGGKDTAKGGGGDDSLLGASGKDTLIGQAGDDTINGGSGRDILTGKKGADVFVIAPGGGRDKITDLVPGTDLLQIDPALVDPEMSLEAFFDAHVKDRGDNTLLTFGKTKALLEGIDDPMSIQPSLDFG